MKKQFLIIFISILFLPGCLTFHRISYQLTLKDEFSGTGIIKVYDIRSDAETDAEFEDDKKTLFKFILNSEQFLTEMNNEGKNISSRKLYKEDNLLNGETLFSFNDIRQVEGISFEDGFYFITMELEDSIYYTNGEIIFSDEFKRIVWDQNIETLIFEMVATDYDDMYYKDLAPYYKE